MVLFEPAPGSDSPASPREPLFDHYTVSTFPRSNVQMEIAMTHVSTTPIDSFYLLMRSTPPQIPAKDAEKVMVGNRSILGWKLSPRGDSTYAHTFAIHLDSASSSSSLSRSNSSPSLASLSFLLSLFPANA